jgi:hypothetical protein
LEPGHVPGALQQVASPPPPVQEAFLSGLRLRIHHDAHRRHILQQRLSAGRAPEGGGGMTQPITDSERAAYIALYRDGAFDKLTPGQQDDLIWSRRPLAKDNVIAFKQPTNNNETHKQRICAAARDYAARGWAVNQGKDYDDKSATAKAPRQKAWTKQHIGTGDQAEAECYFDAKSNIGVNLGEPSKGLVDLDLDKPECVPFADILFKDAPAFGRDSKPRTHRLVISDGAKTFKFDLPPSFKNLEPCKGDHGVDVCEIRSTGGQTVLPPSRYGDQHIRWDLEGEPPSWEAGQLRRAMARLALCAVAKMWWPALGVRNETLMALTGALLNAGASAATTDALVAKLAGPGWNPTGERTQQLKNDGKEFTALPRVVELLGIPEDFTKWFNAKWLGAKAEGQKVDASPHFAELNKANFVIDNKGVIGTHVTVKDRAGDVREVLLMRSPTKFSIAHPQPMLACEYSSGKRPLGEVWSKSKDRRHYPDITFDPSAPEVTADGRLNLWRGFGVEPKEGDWSRLHKHIREVIADGDPKAFDYILRWHAWAFQNPATVAGVALAFPGDEGTGKGVFLRTAKRCFGQHGFQTTRIDDILGRFNSPLEDCCYLYLNEAYVPKDPTKLGTFKGLITEPDFTVEHKGVDISVAWPNNLHIVLDGNLEHIAPVGRGDRRFSIFEVPNIFEEDEDPAASRKKYFDPIYDEIKAGGNAAMLFDLLAMPLSDWRPYPAFRNAAHARQKALSLTGPEIIMERVLQDAHLPGATADRPQWCRSHGREKCSAGIMDEALRRSCNVNIPVSDMALGITLGRYGGEAKHNTARDVRGWEFKSLAECRALWARRHGGAWTWETDTTEWRVDNEPIPF